MAELTGLGWPSQRRTWDTGGGWSANLHLERVLPVLEYLFEPAASRKKTQLAQIEEMATRSGRPMGYRPFEEQRAHAAYTPNIWEMALHGMGLGPQGEEYTQILPTKYRQKVVNLEDLPPVPGKAPRIGVATLPEPYIFEPPKVGLPKEALTEFDKMLVNIGISDPRTRQKITTRWATEHDMPKTPQDDIYDAQTRAQALYTDPKEQADAIAAYLTNDPKRLPLPAEVKKADRIIAENRKKFRGMTDYEIAKQVLDPDDFGRWVEYRETLIRMEETNKQRRDAALQHARDASERKAESHFQKVLLQYDRDATKAEQNARTAYDKWIGGLGSQIVKQNAQKGTSNTVEDHIDYQSWDDWFSEKGKGAQYRKAVDAANEKIDRLLESETKLKKLRPPERVPKVSEGGGGKGKNPLFTGLDMNKR